MKLTRVDNVVDDRGTIKFGQCCYDFGHIFSSVRKILQVVPKDVCGADNDFTPTVNHIVDPTLMRLPRHSSTSLSPLLRN